MKKSLFASLAAVVLAAACTTTNPTVEPKLTVEGLKLDANKTVNVAAAASDLTFTVNANVSYTIVSDKDWAVPAPAAVEAENNADKTTSVKIGITANTEENARTAKISIVAEENASLNYEFTINQAALTKSLSVTNYDMTEISGPIEVESTGASASVMVVSTVSWTATSDAEWLTVEPASLTIENYEETPAAVSFQIEDNPAEEVRTATVTFKGEGVEDVTITVNQDCVFTAAVELMSVTDFNPEYLSDYPDETSLGAVWGLPTAPVASGYFGRWKSTAWEAELADWEGNLESIITDVKEHGVQMSDEMVAALNSEKPVWGTIFSGLTSDTEYILIVLLEDTKGRTYVGYDLATTKAYDVKFYGTAVWNDVFVNGFFDMSKLNTSLPCDVYTIDTTPGVLYFDSPFWYHNIASWFGETPESMKQYDGNYKQVYIGIDCSNPDAVTMPAQELGVCMNSQYGWFLGGTGEGASGIYKDNTITIDGYSLGVAMSAYQDGAFYYVAENPGEVTFTINITPGGSPAKPAAVAHASVAGKLSGKANSSMDSGLQLKKSLNSLR